MKTPKAIFLITSISSLLISCGININSSSKDDSSAGGNSSTTQYSSSDPKSNSEQSSAESRSMPSFDNLDHVKLFVAKTTNTNEYTHVYAWNTRVQILGAWPGTTLTDYNEDWRVFDFDKQYDSFSIVINIGSDRGKTGDLSINGIGAYWYYDDALVKNDTMPDINPPAPSSSSSNPESSSSGSPASSSEEPVVGDDLGNIFHAFDWSLNVIKSRLNDIAKAGYTAIQTSPLQQPKDYYGDSRTSDWWKLYQPLSFNLPTENYYLGNANDLKSLTTAAHNLNLKIIVDVVANHMGGDGNNPNDAINRYEPAIMADRNNTFRSVDQCSDWNNRYDVTHKRLGGYPELNTGNTTVQNEVYTYLKELVDNGVDGFRFDAAKHIETPFDNNEVKSEFWNKTASKAYTYASNTYNKKLYMYGEILDNCAGVPFDYYTNILDAITDNKTGNNILSAVRSGNSNGAGNSHYETNVSPDKLVLWGESHDTYMNTPEYGGISRDADQKDVDKAYALVASRKAARGLYFARPNWGSNLASGDTQNQNYKNKLISGVNKLKNDMGNNNETVGSSSSLAYVARHGNNGYGATIVNVNGSGEATLSISNLVDGTYKDLISGNTYTMNNGSITVNISSEYGATVIELVK